MAIVRIMAVAMTMPMAIAEQWQVKLDGPAELECDLQVACLMLVDVFGRVSYYD